MIAIIFAIALLKQVKLLILRLLVLRLLFLFTEMYANHFYRLI